MKTIFSFSFCLKKGTYEQQMLAVLELIETMLVTIFLISSAYVDEYIITNTITNTRNLLDETGFKRKSTRQKNIQTEYFH